MNIFLDASAIFAHNIDVLLWYDEQLSLCPLLSNEFTIKDNFVAISFVQNYLQEETLLEACFFYRRLQWFVLLMNSLKRKDSWIWLMLFIFNKQENSLWLCTFFLPPILLNAAL